MVSSELINLIEHGREERNIEYKSSMDWSSPLTKAKVAKSTMAMSNISGGGAIIFGVEEDSDGFHLVGMANGDFESFNQDDVMDHINGFADPYVELTLSPVKQQDGKLFVVIQVREFEELPVVCRKAGYENLRQGAVYTRSRRKYETAEIGSQTEMREILNLAVDKEIFSLRQRGVLLSHAEIQSDEKDRDLFEKELAGL